MNAGDNKTGTLEAVDIQRILEMLPHRYPFLMIDRVIDMDGDESGTGVKNVTVNEPQFMGHFPENPVFPGVLMIEGMAQTAGALCIAASEGGEKQPLIYFMTIDKAKFRKPVRPGDQIHYHVTKLRRRANIWRYGCVATVDGQKVAEAELSATLVIQ